MENSKFNIDLINEKNRRIDEAKIALKNEFVGIDEQIEQILENIRTWYIYPELQTRPLVINLWGMSGTGKTSLVKRMVNLLGIDENLTYFNFAAISEMNGYEVESELNDEVNTGGNTRIFVYDEFQYAAVINENGDEKDDRGGLKPFWELMDSGLVKRNKPYSITTLMMGVVKALETINRICPIQLENGVWKNCEECFNVMTDYEKILISKYLQPSKEYERNKDQNGVERIETDSPYIGRSSSILTEIDFIIPVNIIRSALTILYNKDEYDDSVTDYNIYKFIEDKLRKMSATELMLFFVDIYDKAAKGYDLNFSKSVVIVIGNLDEAYRMTFDTNPDMSPDEFHRLTQKINIVEIKSALQRRFRNEQIARLGNIHVIYPSFSSSSFKKIIDINLDEYSNQIEKSFNLKITFDKSIKKFIYNDSVFPTQGTRPVLSSIHEIIKSKLPLILRDAIDKGIILEVVRLNYKYSRKHLKVEYFDSEDKLLSTAKFLLNSRLDQMREIEQNDKQAQVAVHESGHFVAYVALKGSIPEKVVSKTADTDSNGFMLSKDNDNEVTSYKSVIDEIKICLGGYMAELIVFGKDYLSNGACSDLEKATALASQAIREWGFGSHPYITTYKENGNKQLTDGRLIKDKDDSVREEVISLFEKAYEELEILMRKKEWQELLKNSSKYLFGHNEMPCNKMRELYDKVPDDVKVKSEKGYYIDSMEQIGNSNI